MIIFSEQIDSEGALRESEPYLGWATLMVKLGKSALSGLFFPACNRCSSHGDFTSSLPRFCGRSEPHFFIVFGFIFISGFVAVEYIGRMTF